MIARALPPADNEKGSVDRTKSAFSFNVITSSTFDLPNSSDLATLGLTPPRVERNILTLLDVLSETDTEIAGFFLV
jgi:hypothetical protein